jgi:hypothetical protein
MANALNDHVWRLDTANSSNLTDESQILDSIIVHGTGASDDVVIENGEGDVVFSCSVAVAGDTLSFTGLRLRLLHGFSVPTLTAGCIVYLYGALDV